MPSIRAHILDFILRIHNHKRNLKKLGELKKNPDRVADFTLKKLAKNRGFKIPEWMFWDISHSVIANGRAAFFSSESPQGLSHRYKAGKAGKKVIFYLHGGGYFNGMLPEHWHFIRRLVKSTNCSVLVYDYLLTPENTYRDVFMDLYKFYCEYFEKNHKFEKKHKKEFLLDFKKIYFAGDSAGAGLALAFTMHLRNLKKSLPARLFLFSPFLDVTCSNPEIKKYQKSDLILDALGGETAGMLYSGAYMEPDAFKYMARLKHWMVSPMFGDVSGLPPIHIFGGAREILRPDIELFHKKLLKYGNNGSLRIKEGMQHIYMIFAIPEANEVLNLISNYIN